MTNDRTDFILRVVAGPDLGGLFSLHRQRLIVGRSSTADISLSDPAVARSHCCIVWDVERAVHMAEDWGHPGRISLNGVEVARHARSVLKIGDELQIGKTVLRYESA